MSDSFASSGRHPAAASVLRAALAFGSATVVVKCARLAQESLVAMGFGTYDEIEAFLVAWVIFNFLLQTVLVSLHTALIPELVRLVDRRDSSAVSKLLTAMAGAVLLAAVLIALSASVWLEPVVRLVGSGFSAAKCARTVHLFYSMTPVFPIAGLSLLAASFLQAEKRFFASALLPLATPALTVALLAAPGAGLDAGTLVWGLVAGAVIELCCALALLLRRGIRPRFSRLVSGELRTVISQAAALAAGAILMSATSLVETAFAAAAGAGTVASMAYAMRVPSLVLGLLSVPISAAILPFYAEAFARDDRAGGRVILVRWVAVTSAVSIVITTVLFALSPHLVRVFYQRGLFSSADAAAVALLQQLFLLHLPFFMVGLCGVRFLIAARRTAVLAMISAANLIVYITLNLIGADWPHAAGVPLATAGMYAFSMSTILIVCFRATRPALPEASRAESRS